ncbi:MAG TPA: hypothetical protein VFN21_02815 [Acidimicrobiales bacterium]|nr:hypothetical protein [Acidimicrobiales bacterium]
MSTTQVGLVSSAAGSAPTEIWLVPSEYTERVSDDPVKRNPDRGNPDSPFARYHSRAAWGPADPGWLLGATSVELHVTLFEPVVEQAPSSVLDATTTVQASARYKR